MPVLQDGNRGRVVVTLSQEDRKFLLAAARGSAAAAAGNERFTLGAVPPSLQERGASFVTLTSGGGLRGCVGSLSARRSLAQDVTENAQHAAIHDSRFPPVHPDELEAIRIEVSVLSFPVERKFKDASDLVATLGREKPGVVLSSGFHSATFLPQVWKQLPEPEEFLSHLCVKAELPPDAWQTGDIRVETYTVEKFEER